MRVVLDTNVLVRAMASPSGPAGELFERVSADHVLAASLELLEELSRVLGYDSVRRIHRRTDVAIAEFLASLGGGATVVVLPKPLPRVVPGDPKDDLVVATAVAGRADVICTLDHHFYQDKVRDYCREGMIEITDDLELLARLRKITDDVK
ncbi:MAG: putative toxin-antitoxin system toxin component, PIN family [Thermoguttaceae bacterium]|jgi:putative PIN family toxin of toxin-antitoxin system